MSDVTLLSASTATLAQLTERNLSKVIQIPESTKANPFITVIGMESYCGGFYYEFDIEDNPSVTATNNGQIVISYTALDFDQGETELSYVISPDTNVITGWLINICGSYPYTNLPQGLTSSYLVNIANPHHAITFLDASKKRAKCYFSPPYGNPTKFILKDFSAIRYNNGKVN